jgi:hypothetical protein
MSTHSDARFRRTVERIAKEVSWLHTYQNALDGMVGVRSIGMDFFRVAMTAIKDAQLIRLIRVLERDSKTSSFWYLLRVDAPVVEKAAKASRLDLDALSDVAERLRGIRDNTFVHIDKDGVFDPQHFYREAKIKEREIKRLIDGLWNTMQRVHSEVLGEPLRSDEYTGEDIRDLAEMRDGAASCSTQTPRRRRLRTYPHVARRPPEVRTCRVVNSIPQVGSVNACNPFEITAAGGSCSWSRGGRRA